MKDSILSSTALISKQCYKHVRIAFDVGSSTTKAKAGVYCDDELVKGFGMDYKLMPYQEYLNKNSNTLPEDAKTIGQATMKSLIRYFYSLSSDKDIDVKVAGIASAWARRASNADDYLDSLSNSMINLEIISQDKEGEIGYKSVIANAAFLDDSDKDIVVCDIGGGSFQISFDLLNDIKVYHGQFGSVNFFDSVKKTLGHTSTEDNYRFLSSSEVDLARELSVSNIEKPLESFKKVFLDNKNNIYIKGIGQFLNDGIRQFFSNDIIYRSKLEDLMYKFSDMTAEDAIEMYPNIKEEYVYNYQTNMILLYSVMKALNVEELDLIDATPMDYLLADKEVWSSLYPVSKELFSNELISPVDLNTDTDLDAA